MSRELIKKLKAVKSQNGRINPDRAWVMRNREVMLDSIRQSAIELQSTAQPQKNVFDFTKRVSQCLHIFVSKKVLSFARAGMTLMLVVGVTVSSWIAGVSASSDSLPGEIMYNVKMATETTELMVSNMIGSKEDQVTTILKHASIRVNEYERSTSSDQATQAIKLLQEKIESSSETLNKVEKESPEIAIAVAQVIEMKTDEILTSLADTSDDNKKDEFTAGTSVIPAAQLEKELNQAHDLIQQAGIKAVEMIVQKVENNEVSESIISKEEVKEKIAKKLDQIVSDVSKLDVEIIKTSQIMASSTELFAQTDAATSSTLVITVSNNITVSSTVSTTAQLANTDAIVKVEEANKKVEETNKIVETTKIEVQTFIDQNNLTAALEKLKELGGVKNETKEVVQSASSAVKEVATVEEPKPIEIPLATPQSVVSSTSALPVTPASSTAQTVSTTVKIN